MFGGWAVELGEKARIPTSYRGHHYFTSVWGQIKLHSFFLWQFAHLLEGAVWVMVLTLKLAHIVFLVALTVSRNVFPLSTCVCLKKKKKLKKLCISFSLQKCLVKLSKIIKRERTVCLIQAARNSPCMSQHVWVYKTMDWKKPLILLNSLTINCRWRHVSQM